MAIDFFEIGKGGASRARKIDYSKALDPLAKKVETRVKESKAKTEALINSMPQGVAIDKVPEELRGQVTDFLAKNKQEYVDASRVIASGIRPTDQRYIDAMATINGVNSKFQNLSNQLEDIALKRQAALDGRDHSKGAFDWEISDHESLANGSMYANFSLQDDGSFNYLSNDGKTKKWSDYSNTFQTNSAGQEAYINLENLVINNASKGVEFNRKTYEIAFDGIIKTLKTDGARDFVFSDEKFLEEQTNEKFGTPEYEKAVSALRNKGNFESILKKYKKYAVDELSKVHITPYNKYNNRQNSNTRSKKQYFLGGQYLTGPAAEKVDVDVANINSSEDFPATISWNGVIYRRVNGQLQARNDDGDFIDIKRTDILLSLGGLSESEGIKPLEGPEFTPPPVEEEQEEDKTPRKNTGSFIRNIIQSIRE